VPYVSFDFPRWREVVVFAKLINLLFPDVRDVPLSYPWEPHILPTVVPTIGSMHFPLMGHSRNSSAVRCAVTEPEPIPSEREELERFQGLLPESQGHNLALTVLCVPYSLDSGLERGQ